MEESKTLSQRDIDALLDSLGSGREAAEPEQAKKLKRYDFRSPARFSRDQMRTLQMIFEEFGRQTSSVLSIMLRSEVKARFVYLEQSSGESLAGMFRETQAAIVALIRLSPLPGRALLVLAGDLVWTLVERVLGSTTTTPVADTREITDIEQSLMEAVMRHILGGLQSAWGRVIDVTPGIDSSSVDRELVQGALNDEVVISAMLEVAIGETTGSMAFLMPFTMLNPIAPALRPHLLAIHASEDEEKQDAGRERARSAMLRQLQRAPVPVSVLLGEAELAFRDLMLLQPGDVIRLDRNIDDELVVKVSGESKFLSRPGLKGSSLAVRITGLVRQEVE